MACQIANENYARELMQLFTTGIYMLNQDGTLQLDGSGNPIPVVYGGAGAGVCAGVYGMDVCSVRRDGDFAKFPNPANYTAPMVAVESAARYDGEDIAERDDAACRAVDFAGPERRADEYLQSPRMSGRLSADS